MGALTLMPRCLAFAAALVSSAPASAFEARNYPEFMQINAIAPRPDGGFAIAGFLRGEGNKTPSALLEIAANGDWLAAAILQQHCESSTLLPADARFRSGSGASVVPAEDAPGGESYRGPGSKPDQVAAKAAQV